jgi:hypothetical protein
MGFGERFLQFSKNPTSSTVVQCYHVQETQEIEETTSDRLAYRILRTPLHEVGPMGEMMAVPSWHTTG